jgi:hypothetical protein
VVGPSWKELSFSVLNRADMEACNIFTYIDHLLIEILSSHPINVLQNMNHYPWAYLL